MDCSICTLNYNDSLREKIECYSCGFSSCKTCVRTYLTTNQTSAQCMNCGTKFSLNFMVRKLNRSWVLGKFKDVTCVNLLQKQKSLIPETMPYAEAEQEKRRYRAKKNVLQERIQVLSNEIKTLTHESNAYSYLIRGTPIPERYRAYLEGAEIKVDTRKKFIMACPQEGCKGFLSTAYKCALCNQHTCSDCLVVLGITRGEHVCIESDKLSAELIKKETKPCPTCGERIYKVSGCDQMYCTQCHTAFSWKTGQIEHGTIHNPHFYELQRINGTAIRNVGDIQCGGMPDIRVVLRTMEQMALLLPMELKKEYNLIDTRIQIRHAHRRLTEHVTYHVDIYRTRIRELGDTRTMLVAYILNDITEEQLSMNIYKNNKELQKNTDIYHVMEINSVTGIETFIDIVETVEARGGYELDDMILLLCDINAKLEKLDKVRKYCNDQLKEISITYSCTVPIFDTDFTHTSKKYNISGSETK